MDVRIGISVVVSLGFVACICVGGIVLTDAIGREPPANLGTIAGTCVGALAMLLVHPITRPALATPPNVVNTILPPK